MEPMHVALSIPTLIIGIIFLIRGKRILKEKDDYVFGRLDVILGGSLLLLSVAVMTAKFQ